MRHRTFAVEQTPHTASAASGMSARAVLRVALFRMRIFLLAVLAAGLDRAQLCFRNVPKSHGADRQMEVSVIRADEKPSLGICTRLDWGLCQAQVLNFFEAKLSLSNAPLVFRVADHAVAPARMGWRRHGHTDGAAGPTCADIRLDAACRWRHGASALAFEHYRLGGRRRLWLTHRCAGCRRCHGCGAL